MHLAELFKVKIKKAIRALDCSPDMQNRIDFEFFPVLMPGTREFRYMVVLFVPVDEDHAAPMEDIDPYAAQDDVSAMVAKLFGFSQGAPQSAVLATAPGISPAQLRASRSGLLLP